MIKKFAEKNLIKKSIKYATRSQIKNECWHVEGIIKNRSNETLRFDIRKMDTSYKKRPAKRGFTFAYVTDFSKADKMVFETKKEWVLLDMQEIQDLLESGKMKIFYLDNLIRDLEWNIILPK